MSMIPYNPSIQSEHSFLAVSVLLLTVFTVAIIQYCSSDECPRPNLRINIPPHVETPPATPSPKPKRSVPTPPPAPSRPKKVSFQPATDFDLDILYSIAKHPGLDTKCIYYMLRSRYPDISKHEINSRLYTMLRQRRLRMYNDSGVPYWFLSEDRYSSVIVKYDPKIDGRYYE